MLTTPLLNTVASINATACFLLGVSLNITLIWLILKRSPTSLRTYSRVILQSALLNIVYLITTACYIPVQLASAKGSLTYGVGWILRANDGSADTRTWNFTVHCVWGYMVFFTQLSIVVLFLFRYFAVCHGIILTGLQYGVVLAVAAVVATFHVPFYLMAGVELIMILISLLNCCDSCRRTPPSRPLHFS